MPLNLSLHHFPIPPPLRLFPPKFIPICPRSPELGFRLQNFSRVGKIMAAAPEEKIDLTEKEEKIFNLLMNVLKHFEMDTQIRVAGGWVRDKLLGKDCYDIDIALDNMLGREFCEKVNEYQQYAGEEHHDISFIPRNPDKSKHLETTRMRIYDTKIDFVNLRSETYAVNSRIPTMKFGTAKEDAYRRDLTINSLFYNIHTHSVEDFTGRGVQDLKNGYITTPLPPKCTFLDDPLRVLRAIRFGARFAFVLDEELKKAASDAEVKAALADKISRERIGDEVDLMISGNRPSNAMAYICDLQLFFVVFALPENPQPDVIEGYDRLCVSFMDASWGLFQMTGLSKFSDLQQKLYLYGSLFLPLRNTVYLDSKSKQIPVASYILRNSLRRGADYAEKVVSLHAASERFISLIPFLESNRDSEIFHSELEDEYLDIPPTSKRRVLAGLLIHEIRDLWRFALLMSTLLYPTADLPCEIFFRVESAIMELELDNVWELNPLLDGNAIMDVLQLKPDPDVKKWQDRLLKWQLAHPRGTRDECLDWMRQCQVMRVKLDCFRVSRKSAIKINPSPKIVRRRRAAEMARRQRPMAEITGGAGGGSPVMF